MNEAFKDKLNPETIDTGTAVVVFESAALPMPPGTRPTPRRGSIRVTPTLRKKICQAITKLSKKDRQILTLVYEQHKTRTQAGKELGMSYPAAYTAVGNALDRLGRRVASDPLATAYVRELHRLLY